MKEHNSVYNAAMLRTVIATDEYGNDLGDVGLLAAHTGTGTLHRAFSVYVFNPERTKMIIQKRSDKKMLWPLIWANTCCSHPMRGEAAGEAGERRLKEELGFTVPLREGTSFVYRAVDPSGKGLEHEYDTILIGSAPEDLILKPNPDEVSEWTWIDLPSLQADMEAKKDSYAPWFHLGLSKAISCLKQ